MNTKRIVHVNTSFRGVEPSEALKVACQEKIGHVLQKFVHHDTEAHVVLKVEKTRQIAELSFHTDGANFAASEESGDMYTSLDQLVSSITRQLSKHKEKLTAHHR